MPRRSQTMPAVTRLARRPMAHRLLPMPPFRPMAHLRQTVDHEPSALRGMRSAHARPCFGLSVLRNGHLHVREWPCAERTRSHGARRTCPWRSDGVLGRDGRVLWRAYSAPRARGRTGPGRVGSESGRRRSVDAPVPIRGAATPLRFTGLRLGRWGHSIGRCRAHRLDRRWLDSGFAGVLRAFRLRVWGFRLRAGRAGGSG
jgi:hypothetical protein